MTVLKINLILSLFFFFSLTEARYTAASMENARRADQRHSTAKLKKKRQERIKILKPIEVGLF